MSAERAIEQAITDDYELTDKGKALVVNTLAQSITFLDSLWRFLDATFQELTASRYSRKKTWHLVTALGIRIFTNIYEPRLGILGVIKTCDRVQVSTTVLYACLKSHDIIREFKESKYKDHTVIASEYIKFLAHNLPFKLVETLENKFKSVESDLKIHKSQTAGHVKQLNTVTQKVDEVKLNWRV